MFEPKSDEEKKMDQGSPTNDHPDITQVRLKLSKVATKLTAAQRENRKLIEAIKGVLQVYEKDFPEEMKDTVGIIAKDEKDLREMYDNEIKELREKYLEALRNQGYQGKRIIEKSMTLAQRAKTSILESDTWDESQLQKYLKSKDLARFYDIYYRNPEESSKKLISLESLLFEKDPKKPRALILYQGLPEHFVNLLTIPYNCMTKALWHYDRFFYHFLLIFPIFMQPIDLVYSLIKKWNNLGISFDGYDYTVKQAILDVLREWIILYRSPDLVDKELYDLLTKFIKSQIEDCRELRSNLIEIQENIQYFREQALAMPPPYLYIRSNVVSKFTNLTEIDPLEMAKQLTILEMKIFNSINRNQLLIKDWKKKKSSDKVIKSFGKHSKSITSWITTEILKLSKASARAELISYFITVLEHLEQQNNFSTMGHILLSLRSSIITKLKRSWKFISNKTRESFDNLSILMSNSHNYKTYYNKLEKLPEGTTCIPLIKPILEDICEIYETHPIKNPNGWINWNMMNLLASKVAEIVRFEYATYNFKTIEEIQEKLQNAERWENDDVCYDIAVLREKVSDVEDALPSYTTLKGFLDTNRKNLTERDWSQLLADTPILTFNPEEVILKENTVNNFIFRIKSGKAILNDHQDKELPTRLSEGDTFGEISMLSGEIVSSAIIALNKVEVYKDNSNHLHSVCSHNPELYCGYSLYLAKKMAKYLRYVSTKEFIKKVTRKVEESFEPSNLNEYTNENSVKTNEDENDKQKNKNPMEDTLNQIEKKLLERVTKNNPNQVSKNSNISISKHQTVEDPKDKKKRTILNVGKRSKSSGTNSKVIIKKDSNDKNKDKEKEPVKQDSPSQRVMPMKVSSEEKRKKLERSNTEHDSKQLKKSGNANKGTIISNSNNTNTDEHKQDVIHFDPKIKPKGLGLLTNPRRRSMTFGSRKVDINIPPTTNETNDKDPQGLISTRNLPQHKRVDFEVNKEINETPEKESQKLPTSSLNASSKSKFKSIYGIFAQKNAIEEGGEAKYQSEVKYLDAFHLDDEVIVKEWPCTGVRTIENKKRKTPGRLYVSKNYVCFSAMSFGFRLKNIIDLKSVLEVSMDSKKKKVILNCQTHNKILVFSSFEEPVISVYNLLKLLWETLSHEPTAISKEPSNSEISDLIINNLKEEEDWNLILKGSSEIKYKKGDCIIREGTQVIQLYQIAEGLVQVEKEGVEHPLSYITADDGVFGEVSFVDGDLSSASVIASSDVIVHVIEYYYLNILFLYYPKLAGKFFLHLAQILAKRVINLENGHFYKKVTESVTQKIKLRRRSGKKINQLQIHQTS